MSRSISQTYKSVANQVEDLSKILELIGFGCPKMPGKLIASFSKLEVINMFLRGWDIRYVHEDLIEELGSSQHLTSVSFITGSVFVLEKFLTFQNLKRCTERLCLHEYRKERSFNMLSLAHMNGLKVPDIDCCINLDEMKMKMESAGEVGMTNNLYQLAKTTCCHMLSEVIIFECPCLKDVTWLMLPSNMTSLKVQKCRSMEEIMSEGKLSEVAEVVGYQFPTPFRKLQSLTLEKLPKLKSIYWNALHFLFLKDVNIRECPNLRKLPFNSASAKGNHISIKASKMWWEMLEWEDEFT